MCGWGPRSGWRYQLHGGALGSQVQCCCFLFLQFHYENTRAQFFVEDASTASALKAVNYKILDRENRRVCVKGLAWLGVGIGAQGTDWVLVLGLRPPWSSPCPCVSPLQISIIINSSPPPHTVQNELKPEQVEQLKVKQPQGMGASTRVLPVLTLPPRPHATPVTAESFVFLCS